MRREQKQIDAVELDAVDLGLGRQIEHGVQVDKRLGAGGTLADDAGPGGVVQFGELVFGHHGYFLLFALFLVVGELSHFSLISSTISR